MNQRQKQRAPLSSFLLIKLLIIIKSGGVLANSDNYLKGGLDWLGDCPKGNK